MQRSSIHSGLQSTTRSPLKRFISIVVRADKHLQPIQKTKLSDHDDAIDRRHTGSFRRALSHL
jgi:hypothetical protein